MNILLHSLSVDISKTDAKKTTLKRERQKKENIIKLKKKLKVYQQKCRRLQKRVTSMSLLIKHLQDRKLLTDAVELLQVS